MTERCLPSEPRGYVAPDRREPPAGPRGDQGPKGPTGSAAETILLPASSTTDPTVWCRIGTADDWWLVPGVRGNTTGTPLALRREGPILRVRGKGIYTRLGVAIVTLPRGFIPAAPFDARRQATFRALIAPSTSDITPCVLLLDPNGQITRQWGDDANVATYGFDQITGYCPDPGQTTWHKAHIPTPFDPLDGPFE